jgi:hypothetical protein
MNRLGFPNRRLCDSSCVLAKEAGRLDLFGRELLAVDGIKAVNNKDLGSCRSLKPPE